jgi:hypothetical protein
MLFTHLSAAVLTVPSSLASLVLPGGGRTISTVPYGAVDGTMRCMALIPECGYKAPVRPPVDGTSKCHAIGCEKARPPVDAPIKCMAIGCETPYGVLPVRGGVRDIPVSKYPGLDQVAQLVPGGVRGWTGQPATRQRMARSQF